jgi:hypothetical protein
MKSDVRVSVCVPVLVEINRMCAGVHGSRWVGGSGATQPCDHVCWT